MAVSKMFHLSFIVLLVANFFQGLNLLSPLQDIEALLYLITDPLQFRFRNTCYKDIGCFYNGPPWFNMDYRPFSAPPRECEKTTLPLFTPSNPKISYNFTLNATSVENSPYKCELPTIFIAHGFLADNDAYRDMKDKILQHGDYNVIVPDFHDYVLPPYFQAVANMRAVGVRVGMLIKLLMEYCNYKDLKGFHLIGHSMGAHMLSYAGKYVGKKVGRISGLDVAGPYFRGTPPETRLTTKDADFVDAIHTNAARTILELGYGTVSAVGHMDFWVNNGYTQPGCDPIQNVVRDRGINFTHLYTIIGCSHTRATDLYTESVIPSKCKFRGVLCPSYSSFLSKRCPEKTSKTAELGFHLKKMDVPEKSTFYLETNAYMPFCEINGTMPFRSRNPIVNIYDHYFG